MALGLSKRRVGIQVHLPVVYTIVQRNKIVEKKALLLSSTSIYFSQHIVYTILVENKLKLLKTRSTDFNKESRPLH